MKKFGFTLAEILVALAIVGVVAAISIPTMVTENKKKVYANSLSSAVSNLENALTTVIITEGKTSICDINEWKGGYVEVFVENILKKRMQLTMNDSYNIQEVKTLDKKGFFAGLNLEQEKGSGTAFDSKKGFTYVIFDKLYEGAGGFDNLRLSLPVALVAIDVNGNKKPNILGRDVFLYILNKDGYLFPYAGEEYNEFYGDNFNVHHYCDPNSNANKNGITCAARLAQNGYKMDY